MASEIAGIILVSLVEFAMIYGRVDVDCTMASLKSKVAPCLGF